MQLDDILSRAPYCLAALMIIGGLAGMFYPELMVHRPHVPASLVMMSKFGLMSFGFGLVIVFGRLPVYDIEEF
jgi:hypothetical protein